MIDRDMRDIFAAHILGGVTMTREMCTTESIYDRAELMMQERARRDKPKRAVNLCHRCRHEMDGPGRQFHGEFYCLFCLEIVREEEAKKKTNESMCDGCGKEIKGTVWVNYNLPSGGFEEYHKECIPNNQADEIVLPESDLQVPGHDRTVQAFNEAQTAMNEAFAFLKKHKSDDSEIQSRLRAQVVMDQIEVAVKKLAEAMR